MKHPLFRAALCGAMVAAVVSSSPVAVAETDENEYYRLEDVEVPKEAFLEVGGIAFSPDGTMYVCTRRGEIWARKGKDWRVFASGLHEALGINVIGNGDLVVAQRPEMTRVRDTDHDGQADRFDTLTQGFGITGNYHEYNFGPVRDRQGNYYGTLNLGHVQWPGHIMGADAPYRGWAYKVTAKGEFVPFANGFRSPSGIGMSPAGELWVTDNQGDWVATSALYQIREGKFYGHPCSIKSEKGYAGKGDPCDQPPETYAARRTLPAVWFPYGVAGHASSEPVWDASHGKFGPFAGQMFVGDQTKSFVHRVALEKVDGEYQGAVIPFRRGFGSGITRMAFDRDGALYVGGTDRGWGATGGKVYALQRVVWTKKVPFDLLAMSITKAGFDLTFTSPVDPKTAGDLAAYSLQRYHYRYWRTYGSPHMETTPVPVSTVVVSADGKRVSLTLPPLLKEKVYELHLRGLKAASGQELLHTTAFYTCNRLP